jgi:hypothetical protein
MATEHDQGHAHHAHGRHAHHLHHEQWHGTDAPHGAPGHHHSVLDDRAPALIGLVAGAAFIGAVLFGVVQWTNAQFAGHGEGAKAEATK